MFKKLFLALLLPAFALAAKPVVVASIAPVGYLIEQIAGDSLEVISLASGDVHSYEPKPNDMKNISKAKMFFAVGVEFERAWLPRFSANSKELIIVHTDAKIAKIKDEHEHGEHAEHDNDEHEKHEAHTGHEDEEHDEGKDPHIWLNPMLALSMARNICDSLVDTFPENKNLYLENFQNFMNKVVSLDESAKADFAGLKNRKFVVYHPAWAYFAAHYDLEQISIEKDGKEPKMNELAEVIKTIKSENIKVIFADPNRSQKSASIIAEQTGAKVELLDPLAKNWLENMQNAIKAIKNAN